MEDLPGLLCSMGSLCPTHLVNAAGGHHCAEHPLSTAGGGFCPWRWADAVGGHLCPAQLVIARQERIYEGCRAPSLHGCTRRNSVGLAELLVLSASGKGR